MVVVILWLLAGVADAAPAGTYKGRTSQGRSIAFTLAKGSLKGLKFEIDVTCPSEHVWKVSASRFPPIKIVRTRFNQTFRSRTPSATATVTGAVLAKRVTGSLTMKRFIDRENAFCRGKATFSVRR